MAWCNLPEVALIRVLNYLPVLDQIKSARLVCRYWKQIMDSSVLINELILFLEIYPRPVYWYHDGTEVDLNNAFLVNQRSFLENEFSLKHFRRLRRLMVVSRIGFDYQRLFELVEASCQQLEHLQFSYLQFSYLGHNDVLFHCHFPEIFMPRRIYKPNLQLANLRTFYSQGGNIPLGLHFPQLTELYVYSHLNLEQTDEKTRLCIQNLRILLVHELTYPPGFEFSNLEVFYFNEPNPSISLKDFPRLKEIHYFVLNRGNSHQIDGALENLLEQKQILERSQLRNQLRVYYEGLELQNRDDLRRRSLSRYREFGLFSSKLHLNDRILRLVEETPWRLKFNLHIKVLAVDVGLYRELDGLPEGNELVESMFRSAQYINFKTYFLPGLMPVNLFKISDRFRYISCANLKAEFSQTLLDQLPDALPHLVEFTYDRTCFLVCIPNLQFIGRFKSLHHFHVDSQFLSTDELRFIFENCKFINHVKLKKFDFNESHATIELRRDFGRQVYQAVWRLRNRVQSWATFSLEELLDYFEANEWVKKNGFVGVR